MIGQFKSLLRRFARDERGAFFAIFAIVGVVMVATSGAVVDFVRIDSARNRAQLALDAAVLALQPEIFSKSDAAIKAEAQSLLTERLEGTDFTATINEIVTNTTDGQLYLKADLNIPMAFTSLVGVTNFDITVASEATRKKLFVEVAFVLDNSGSMYGTKMANLKTAATCATNIIFYNDCVPAVGAVKNDNVKAAIVPFTFFVNVGSGNKNASWIDQNGASSIANDNFDDDDNDGTTFSGQVDRLALYDGMVGEPWKGCLEARPYPYSVDDTVPTVGTPDTLFVPQFAPDEPDSGGYPNDYIDDDPAACQSSQTGTCSCNKWEYWWVSNGQSCTFTPSGGGSPVTAHNACSCNTWNYYMGWSHSRGHQGNYYCSNVTVTAGASGLSDREEQERLCKYSGATPVYSGSFTGPNAGCPSADILPLTDNTTSIIADIVAMTADGGTNLHEGAAWGMRVLSPTEPFTEGRPYDTATSKVMIIMTDGENTYYTENNMNGTEYYMPYGHLWNGRLGTYGSESSWSMQLKMNTLTLEACAAAKAEGIRIYTIGLNSPNSTTTDMLTNCASDPSMAKFPTAASELNTVFADIAAQLSQLRLSK